VPEGEEAHRGAYLSYPMDDLVRLIALESHRHRAIVIGEDLGTVPTGFRERMTEAGIYGMHVLQFARHGDSFDPPGWYPVSSVAMTSTHDTPTLAGWWSGRDLDVRENLAQFGPGQTFEHEARERAEARGCLWRALREAGAAEGGEMPSPAQPAPFVDAAVDFLARTPSRLALLPVEDATGAVEQPNLPGTTAEHPNWRRRYEAAAAHLLDSGETRRRIAAFGRHGRSRRAR
jgi:4-alpha-glucanotransferase